MEPIPSPPSFELQGPDDVESIQKVRKFFADGQERLADIKRDFNEYGSLFDAKLKLCLCIADLDRHRVEELEKEIAQLKEENSMKDSRIEELKRNNTALRSRLHSYENLTENLQHWTAQQSQHNQKCMANLDSNRNRENRQPQQEQCLVTLNSETVRKMALLMKKPVAPPPPPRRQRPVTKVGKLRQRFDTIADEDDDDGMTNTTTTISATNSDSSNVPCSSKINRR